MAKGGGDDGGASACNIVSGKKAGGMNLRGGWYNSISGRYELTSGLTLQPQSE